MPTAMEPRSASTRRSSAALMVVASIAWSGVIPASTMSASSRRLLPCGATPESVPIATFTPAAMARATASLWMSMSSIALRRLAGGIAAPAAAASSTPWGATRVGTSHVPRSSIISIASSSRKIPCSMLRMPARTADLMPGAPWAWAMTGMPAAFASATSTSSSSSRKWPWRGSSRGDSTPPEVHTLIWSAPARMIARAARRISSGPSTTPDGIPG